MDQDAAACEAKLGKEPELPPDNNDKNVTLSKSVTERLQTGIDDGDRLDNYDKYWINKLACIDESHSVRNNLDIAEAEQTLESIAKYAQTEIKRETNSDEQKNQLKNCFVMARGETLKCSEMIEKFIQQVDRSMYEIVRKDNSEAYAPSSDKKLTYAERFKRDKRF